MKRCPCDFETWWKCCHARGHILRTGNVERLKVKVMWSAYHCPAICGNYACVGRLKDMHDTNWNCTSGSPWHFNIRRSKVKIYHISQSLFTKFIHSVCPNGWLYNDGRCVRAHAHNWHTYSCVVKGLAMSRGHHDCVLLDLQHKNKMTKFGFWM